MLPLPLARRFDSVERECTEPELCDAKVHTTDLSNATMSLKRTRNDNSQDPAKSQQLPSTFESKPIEDRASRFIALFSPDIPPKTLQEHPPYASASHRILAWRKPSKQQSLLPSPNAPGKMLYDTGHDDDGEKYAGRKLVGLLVDMNVVGAVVVARWYGGVMLGPVRFEHILGVARGAVKEWQDAMDLGRGPKKARVEGVSELTAEQEAELKGRLVRQLGDRDASIKVLRELLAEKKAASSQAAGGDDPTQQSQSSQGKMTSSPNYAAMPLKTLRQLEKAKDTSISWILKQIDEAETANVEKKDEKPS